MSFNLDTPRKKTKINIHSQTVFQPIQKSGQLHNIVNAIDELWQMDVVEMQPLREENYNHIPTESFFSKLGFERAL